MNDVTQKIITSRKPSASEALGNGLAALRLAAASAFEDSLGVLLRRRRGLRVREEYFHAGRK